MDILIVAIEEGRWGPARLPRALKEAGLSVAALCPDGHVVAATDYLDRHYALPVTRSSRKMAAALAQAMRDCQPKLVVPADEQVVALLHALVRRGPGVLDRDALATIVGSLGSPERFDAMLMKSDTLALARECWVAVPAGGTVSSATAAKALAGGIGYPVYVKSAFGWAGQGVTRCADEAALVAAMPAGPGRLAPVKALVRRVLARDWFPSSPAMDVQAAVDGRPAMYCAVAWRGRMLAGFAGIPQATVSAQGPSTVVTLGAHEAMAAASERMIAALGASGFIGFDFMLENGTGAALLLECNPRPIQVCHLGARVGADLMGPLAAALAGRPVPEAAVAPNSEVTAVLLPGAAQRVNVEAGADNEDSPPPARRAGGLSGTPSPSSDAFLDIPWGDEGLCRFAGVSHSAMPCISRISPVMG